MPSPSRLLPWAIAATATAGLIATVVAFRAELDAIESQQRLAVQSQRAMQAELGGVDRVVDRLIEQRVEPLFDQARSERQALEASLNERDALIEQLDTTTDELSADALEARIAAIDAAIGARFESVETRVNDALDGITRGQSELERLRGELPKSTDPQRLWSEIVAPVVQVNGEYSVGSAILLRSQPTSDGMRTPILTAWHVVRDVQDDPAQPTTPVPIRIFGIDGKQRDETARVLAWNAARDVALLELNSTQPVPHGAQLASFERLLDVRTFDEVFAVGCPLGTEPVPTFGAVATNDHRVDDLRYWMINAPTYIGNSGGGIFDARSGELLGVFSKIYNHGYDDPKIVPHMGLVVPLDEVYRWLEREGYEVRPGVRDSLTIAPKGTVGKTAAARTR
ncbi:MAG: serine protease [Planctomycetota bacterium]